MNIKKINLGVDIFLHILILFTFLTLFFFFYISVLEKQNLDNTTNNLITQNTENVLDQMNEWQNKLNTLNPNLNVNIDWNKLNTLSDNMINDYYKETPEIKDNNDKLFKGSIIAIICLFMLFTSVVIILKFIFKYDIDLKHILIMNIIIFSITGLMEFLFFQFIASKYVPVNPTDVSEEVIQQIKLKI